MLHFIDIAYHNILYNVGHMTQHNFDKKRITTKLCGKVSKQVSKT